MGVKNLWDVFQENGEEVCISQLNEECLRKHKRKLRLAVDADLWRYHNRYRTSTSGSRASQKAQEQRTCFLRLNSLLKAHVDAVFVFDGPQKPEFKRNKRVPITNPMDFRWMKNLISDFGFTWIQAPGEAEAQCALLEMKGLVDFVLTDDVDALMFGCRNLLRSSSNSGLGSKESPAALFATAFRISPNDSRYLTRPGIVLTAMMSGADYCPEGVKGCGIKTAKEIAKAGYGEKLIACDWLPLKLQDWKAELERNLRNNENNEFSNKHKAIVFDESFPSRDLFESYMNPAVALPTEPIEWGKKPIIINLHQFSSSCMNYTLQQFVSCLAPAIAIGQLAGGNTSIVKIHGTRVHDRLQLTEVRTSMYYCQVMAAVVDSEKSNMISELESEDQPRKLWVAEYIFMQSESGKGVLEDYRSSLFEATKTRKSKRLPEQKTNLDMLWKGKAGKSNSEERNKTCKENIKPRTKEIVEKTRTETKPLSLPSALSFCEMPSTPGSIINLSSSPSLSSSPPSHSQHIISTPISPLRPVFRRVIDLSDDD
ncbi:PIN domain-like protein [Myxozyma melibiosi]|uniref:PIN domain-like protein n=1 Tax=Myxozyma melibiosi TaxID=54550 RepID=A0ABR1F827_9ASCO